VSERSTTLATRDAALLGALLAVFAICFTLHLVEAVRGRLAWVPVYVEPASDAAGYPRVRAFWSADVARDSGLAVGDELLAIGTEDLRGVGRLGFLTRAYQQAGEAGRVPLRVASAEVVRDRVLELRAVPLPWRTSALALAFVVLGALTCWRTRGFAPARLYFLFSFFYGLHWAYFWGGPAPQMLAGMTAFGVGSALAPPLALRAAQTFPVETASRGRAAQLWPWAFALIGAGATTWAFGWPLPTQWGLFITAGGSALFAATVLGILTRNFRRASSIGRRQIKWLLVAIYIAEAPPLLAGAATLLDRNLWWLYELSLVSAFAIPIGFFVAISRDHLYDVDRLISAAGTYTLLSIALIAGLLLGVPRLARMTAGYLDPGVSQAFLSFVAAALVVSGRKRVEGFVQRRFFRERTALEQGAHALRRALGTCAKPSETLEVLGDRLHTLLDTVSTVIYGFTGDEFAPVFARGPAAPPSFAPGGALARVLRERTSPLRLPQSRSRRAWRALDADDSATLQAMGAAVLLPLQQDRGLGGFVCLGDKRSGDLYTQTDLALLGSIADKTSDELLRYREREILEAEREMSARLRRYVPGAVAEQLERGVALTAAERIVTVLFVDLRGYSAFAEPRAPEAIFAAINAYTQVVTRIVREHGGTVVEFNGDGMMVVFGAPDPLPGMERAALLAARALREEVLALRLRATNGDSASLDVGIGIATGAAYVGAIQGADRAIWSALGNTTNLAARLQTLTREYDASICIDEATHRAAGAAADGFKSLGIVNIRGRTVPVQLYTLPLEERT